MRKTRQQRQADTDRTELAAREATVLRTVDWLNANITPIKSPRVGSYQMKHVVERAIGEYVTNGELIAAGMGKRDVDRESSGRR